MQQISPIRKVFWFGFLCFVVALVLMKWSTPPWVERERIAMQDAQGRELPATLWKPAGIPKAVILIGHGVTSNQGIMATISKGFAAQGYLAVAMDFYGHGLSRQRFDWMGNPAQVLVACDWAQTNYPDLPRAYLGHSMGGFAGGEAFASRPDAVGAFVAMGAIPRTWSSTKTLVAAGQFEELFTPEQAAERTKGHADLLISPYSDHNLEAFDPVLLQGMIDWVDGVLVVPKQGGFYWLRWGLVPMAVVLGVGGALALVCAVTRWAAGKAELRGQALSVWRFNPYRPVAALVGCKGVALPPVSGSLPRAIMLGLLFAVLLVALLSALLTVHVFVARLDHVARLLGWLVVSCVFILIGVADGAFLDRIAARTTLQRFLVAALTRGVPLAVVSACLHLWGPPIAFLGMMLGILAFVAVMISLVRALATRSTGDYRAGMIASAVTVAWIFSFWMPLQW